MTTVEHTAPREPTPPEVDDGVAGLASHPTLDGESFDPLGETAVSDPAGAGSGRSEPGDDEEPFDEGDEDDSFAGMLAQIAHVSDIPLRGAATAQRVPEPGDVLGEHFEIIRQLGEGGMGIVYLARDLMLGRQVAVKVLRLEGRSAAQRAELLKAFERDGAATARLRHPNVITIHHLGQMDGAPWLVLELLEGEELSALLERRRLSVLEIVQAGLQIARALEHAHGNGVVHRDLKPQNVFVQRDGVLKVLDFGLAALDVASGERGEGSARYGGTPAYMAPEQWRGEAQDGRCDIWALGVMLYQMVCGELPFATAREVVHAIAPPLPSAHPDALSDALDGVVARALARDPADRFATAAELLEALDGVERELLAPSVHETPYRYLEPFTERDEAWFFGRERESHRLIGLLPTRAMVAVIGPSGAGKSSLVFAGVIPRLARQGRWRFIKVRPGRRPIESLHLALLEVCGERASGLAPTPEALLAEPGRAGQAVRRLAQEEDVRVLVVVDQLEELYTRCEAPDERVAFAHALLSCADDTSSPVRAVVTLREDFLTRLSEHRELRDALVAQLFPLGPPDADGMIEALVEPARRLGYRFEPGLAEAMVAEVRDEAAPLPLMQFAVSQLWERRDRRQRVMSRAVLDGLGGVAGILVEHADTVVLGLPDPGDLYFAQELLCRLVTAEGTRQSADRITLIGMFADIERAQVTLDRLIAGRLLTSSRGGAQDIVELAHDSLIERWGRLASWLLDRRDERVFHQRLEAAASHWADSGRPRGLLWSDETLDEALAQQKRHVVALNAIERDFLHEAGAVSRRRRLWGRLAVLAVLATAALIAGGSWAATLEIDAQRQRAERGLEDARREKNRAEAARHQAEQLAEGMLFELSDELEPLGRLDLLEHIAQSVNTYLDQTATGDSPRERALRQRGVTMRILGDLEHSAGRVERAEAYFVESRAALEQLVALAPSDANAHRDLCITLRRLASVQAERGEFDPASVLMGQALDLLVPWGTSVHASERDREELAQTHYALGNVELERKHVDKASDHYAEGQAIYRRLLEDRPDDTTALRGVAVGYEKLGDVAMEIHDIDGAHNHYQRSLVQARALVERDPRNVRWKRDVAVLYERLGDVALERGRYAEARELHGKSLEIVDLLYRLDPTNANSQRDMAISLEKLGDAEAELGHHEDALEAYGRSLGFTRRQVEQTPGNITLQRDLSITLERVASIQRLLGRGQEAQSTYGEAVVLRRRVSETNPKHGPWRQELALLLRSMGEFELQRRREAEAARYLDEAASILDALVAREPDALDARLALGRTLWLIASGLELPADRRLAQLRRADTLLQQLHDLQALDAEEEGLRAQVSERLAALDESAGGSP